MESVPFISQVVVAVVVVVVWFLDTLKLIIIVNMNGWCEL